MKRLSLIAALSAALVLSACSTPAADPTPTPTVAEQTQSAATPTPTPTPEPEAAESQTIEEVWAKIDCDPDDTWSRVDPVGAEDRSGSCTPFGGDIGNAYFFETSSAASVSAYLASGALEVGDGDALYIDGSVLILTPDAPVAQALNDAGFESAD